MKHEIVDFKSSAGSYTSEEGSSVSSNSASATASVNAAAVRRQWSIEDKLRWIGMVENEQLPRAVVLRRYPGLSSTTLSMTLRRKRFIMKKALVMNGVSASRKRLRAGMYEQVEEELVRWIKSEGRILSNGQIPRPESIRRKATEIASRLGVTGFGASTGWLHRFKHRYDLTVHPVLKSYYCYTIYYYCHNHYNHYFLFNS